MSSSRSPARQTSGPPEASTSASPPTTAQQFLRTTLTRIVDPSAFRAAAVQTEAEQPRANGGSGSASADVRAPPSYIRHWHYPHFEDDSDAATTRTRVLSSFERRRREEEVNSFEPHESSYDQLFDYFVHEPLPFNDAEQEYTFLGENEEYDGEQAMDWRAEDEADSSDSDDELRLAMNQLAQAADHSNQHTEDYTVDQLVNLSSPYEPDEPTPSIFAQRMADRRAAAASRSLRDLYGTTYPDPWQGAPETFGSRYIGSRPLNEPSTFDEEARPSVTRLSAADWLEQDRQSRVGERNDPSSATSATSFLTPGIVLKGEQIFIDRKVSSSLGIPTTTAPPVVRAGGVGLSSYERLVGNAELRAASERRQRTSATAYQNLFSSNVPNPSLSTDDDNAAALERLLAALREEDVSPGSSAPYSSLTSQRRAQQSARPVSLVSGYPERWAVSVTVQTYNPASASLSGVMYALGINRAKAPTVSTHFIGQILHPAVDGLWTSESAKTLPLTEWGVKRASQAGKHWAGVGPFKDVAKDELTTRMRDLKWLRSKTQGWVLMRWKETGFVNVGPKDSTLSIAGFYHCALNRQNGHIDGLYFDPVASPHQRLNLSPATGGGVSFALESFELR